MRYQHRNNKTNTVILEQSHCAFCMKQQLLDSLILIMPDRTIGITHLLRIITFL